MKRRMRAALVLIAALTVALVELTSAQGTSGSLTGQVVDPSGAAIPGVTVTVTNPATGDSRVTVTTETGTYRVTALPVGTYTLSYQLEGFKTTTRPGILVEASVPRAVNVTLELGGISEVVSVEAGTPILNVSTPTVTRRLGGEEITAVPSSTVESHTTPGCPRRSSSARQTSTCCPPGHRVRCREPPGPRSAPRCTP